MNRCMSSVVPMRWTRSHERSRWDCAVCDARSRLRPQVSRPWSSGFGRCGARRLSTTRPTASLAYHQYQPSELESRVDRTDKSSPYATSETVSFHAAYANDRVIAHLFLPKSAVPPYQVVIVFGGADLMSAKHMEDLQYGYPYEFLIRSGRAVMIPAYWGTLERGPSEWHLPFQEERERSLKWSWDLSRSVDYLQARREIDATKLGFYAISWGATHAPRLLAVDTRFKAAAL